MAQASLLACEGLAGVSLVPTAASKKMMLSQIASKQAENGERAGSPDVLRCCSMDSEQLNASFIWLFAIAGILPPALLF